MTHLLNRLERLEREQPATRQRIVWMEKGDTQSQALGRVAPMQPGETPVFVGWSSGHT